VGYILYKRCYYGKAKINKVHQSAQLDNAAIFADNMDSR